MSTGSITEEAGYTPAFTITKGGQDITANLDDRLISLQVESASGGTDILTIVLDDRDAAIASPSTDGSAAATLSVSLGYLETGLVAMGDFLVTTVVYGFTLPRTMTLTGTSIDMTSNVKAPVITSHDETTLAGVAGTIADAAGVSLRMSAGLGASPIQFLNQNQSAMHLLKTLQDRYNIVGKFADGSLSITERGGTTSATGQTLSGVALVAEDLAPGCQIQESARSSYSTTRTSFFDTTNNQTVWVSSAASGPSSSPAYTVVKPFSSQAEAQAAADSQQAALNRGMRTGTLILSKGLPQIQGGTPVTVSGIRDGVDGSFMIDVATHTLTKNGGLGTRLSVWSDGTDYSATTSASSLTSQGDAVDLVPSDRTQLGGIGHA